MSSPAPGDIDTGASSAGADDPVTSEQLIQDAGPETQQQSSESLAPTPATGLHIPVRCALCEEEFSGDSDNGLLASDALREHMSTAHADAASFPRLEQETNGETTVPPSNDEEKNRIDRPHGGMSVEQRFGRLWNIHDVGKFTSDYDGEESGLPDLWADKLKNVERPVPYEKTSVEQAEFLPMSDPESYVNSLKNPNSRSTDALYAVTANAAHALKVWQDERIAIEKLKRKATRNTTTKPLYVEKREDFYVYEDEKEATLYNYKHDADPKKVGIQRPFFQGGFVPTPAQQKKLEDEFKAKGTRNIDGWTPTVKDGKEYIPWGGPDATAVKKKKPTNARARGASSNNEGGKRETRFKGSKHPATRDASQARTAPSSPKPARGARWARLEVLLNPAQESIEEEAAATPGPVSAAAAAPTSAPAPKAAARGRGARRGRSTATAAASKGKSPVPPSASPAPAALPTAGASGTPPVYENPLDDPKNQHKINISKNPKRTEAMILHWAKFNSQGRVRNPKRTKEQIEKDKQSEKDAADSAENTKKRKLDKKKEPGTSVFSIKKPKRNASETPGTPAADSAPEETPQPPEQSLSGDQPQQP